MMESGRSDEVAVFHFFRGPLEGDREKGEVLQIHASVPFISVAQDFNFPYQHEPVHPRYREDILYDVLNLRREIINADRQSSRVINPRDIPRITKPVQEETRSFGERKYRQALIHCAEAITKRLGLEEYIFRFLFSLENKVQLIKICTDELDIPWDWVYDSRQDKFLCEIFGIGITYPNTTQPISHYQKKNDYSRTAEDIASKNYTAVIVGNTYTSSKESLKQTLIELGPETYRLGDLLKKTFGRTAVDTFVDKKRGDITDYIVQHANELRLICFSGHFTKYGFLTSDSQFFTKDSLSRAFDNVTGEPFAAQPVVILNGCCSSGSLSSEIGPQMNEKRELASAFLALGAGACVVTSTDVRLPYSIQFLDTLLENMLTPNTTLGTALLRARNAMDKERCYEWAVYHLLGDPAYVMIR